MKSKILGLLGVGLLVGPLTASATTIVYSALLSGAAENPPNGSAGTGVATVTVDDVLDTMRVRVTFSGLSSGTTASHIHCCIASPGNAAVATQTPSFVGFPSGVTSGTYDNTFDMTQAASYRAGFISANGGTVNTAWAALLLGLGNGQAYLNIHTTQVPGGEIRGFLTAVPEPGTLALFGLGLAGLGLSRRRKP